MENLKENFVLLSKVAKEKKYAQEYLGLLARRGDIGSIRIGKRWYTTAEWFEEFLENSQKKKSESIFETPDIQPTKVEPAKVFLSVPELKKDESVFIPLSGTAAGEGEKVLAARPAASAQLEKKVLDEPAKAAVSVRTKPAGMIVRKKIATGMGDVRRAGITEGKKVAGAQAAKVQIRNFVLEEKRQVFAGSPKETNFRNISVEERNRHVVPYREIKLKKKSGVFSPDFTTGEKMSAPVFVRLAFSFSFAIIILLVAASGYFVYSGGLLKGGIVAGASDEKTAGLDGIRSESEDFLVSAGDKIRESMSVSRVIVELAREKEKQEEKSDRKN